MESRSGSPVFGDRRLKLMTFVQKSAIAFRRFAFAVVVASAAGLCGASAQEKIAPANRAPATVRLEAEQQRKEGDLFIADGKVEIEYRNLVLHADHVQYNTKTYVVTATGNVTLDVDTQHLVAGFADFNMRSGVGIFKHVRGEVTAEHRPNSNVLVSPNPLTIQAE